MVLVAVVVVLILAVLEGLAVQPHLVKVIMAALDFLVLVRHQASEGAAAVAQEQSVVQAYRARLVLVVLVQHQASLAHQLLTLVAVEVVLAGVVLAQVVLVGAALAV